MIDCGVVECLIVLVLNHKKIAHLAEDWAIFALRVCCSIYLFFVFKKQGIFII